MPRRLEPSTRSARPFTSIQVPIYACCLPTRLVHVSHPPISSRHLPLHRLRDDFSRTLSQHLTRSISAQNFQDCLMDLIYIPLVYSDPPPLSSSPIVVSYRFQSRRRITLTAFLHSYTRRPAKTEPKPRTRLSSQYTEGR